VRGRHGGDATRPAARGVSSSASSCHSGRPARLPGLLAVVETLEDRGAHRVGIAETERWVTEQTVPYHSMRRPDACPGGADRGAQNTHVEPARSARRRAARRSARSTPRARPRRDPHRRGSRRLLQPGPEWARPRPQPATRAVLGDASWSDGSCVAVSAGGHPGERSSSGSSPRSWQGHSLDSDHPPTRSSGCGETPLCCLAVRRGRASSPAGDARVAKAATSRRRPTTCPLTAVGAQCAEHPVVAGSSHRWRRAVHRVGVTVDVEPDPDGALARRTRPRGRRPCGTSWHGCRCPGSGR
jgi:hypothetical protein